MLGKTNYPTRNHGFFPVPFFIISFLCQVFATTYYLDFVAGNDNNTGVSTVAAWKSLAKFNATTFKSGDTVLLKCGSAFTGLMQMHGSGSAINPVIVDAYGTGAIPRIDGGGIADAVLVSGVDYWEIRNLEITNQSTARPTYRRNGVHLQSTGTVRRHIHLSGLYVHDVNGNLTKGPTEGCGIFFNGNAFDDLLIENCHIVRTDRNGICQESGSRSTNVIIRGNLLEDIGGDCIKLWGTNHGLIEHNVVRGGHTRCTDAAAGIWAFSSDSCIIQFNEVSGMKTCVDGEAFDVDYMTRGAIMQYNYSHDNDGGFMLLCSPGNSFSDGFTVRYNISENDGINEADYVYPGVGMRKGSIFQIGGKSTNGSIYNNTIFVPAGKDIYLIYAWSWQSGIPDNLTFSNNIFYVNGKATYDLSVGTNYTFLNNVYYGATAASYVGKPADAQAITLKPGLVNPGNADTGFANLGVYSFTTADSRFLGKVIANNGGKDILGTTVSAAQAPMVGAIQTVSVGTKQEAYYKLEQTGPWLKIGPGTNAHYTAISFGLIQEDDVALKLVGPRGQLLRTLYNGHANKNGKTIEMNTSSLPYGVYYVKLTAKRGGFVAGTLLIRK